MLFYIKNISCCIIVCDHLNLEIKKKACVNVNKVSKDMLWVWIVFKEVFGYLHVKKKVWECVK